MEKENGLVVKGGGKILSSSKRVLVFARLEGLNDIFLIDELVHKFEPDYFLWDRNEIGDIVKREDYDRIINNSKNKYTRKFVHKLDMHHVFILLVNKDNFFEKIKELIKRESQDVKIFSYVKASWFSDKKFLDRLNKEKFLFCYPEINGKLYDKELDEIERRDINYIVSDKLS